MGSFFNPLVLTILSLVFLIGLFLTTALASALRRSHKRDSKKLLKEIGHSFIYRDLHLFLLPKEEYEGLLFATICAQNVCRFTFIVLVTYTLILLGHLDFWVLLLALIGFFIVGDYLPRILGSRYPKKTLWICAPFSSLYLLLAFPLTYLFIKVSHLLWRTVYFDYLHEPMAEAKQEIIDIIHEADIGSKIDAHDKKMIESVFSFQDRIAREVMIPRVHVFSLPADTTVENAAKMLLKEGYSRVPVYKGTVDNIIGVLMYKDVLRKYLEKDANAIQVPIESLIKSVFYTPETKKISNLLQDFKKKQVHMAIVVDEYGGTEGIVTIEDILEEIVGEIEDEYDEDVPACILQPDGSWILDGRISILDAEEQMDLKFPEEGDFDTVGGYVFHCAGTIPSKGFTIDTDHFKLEVLRSNDRRVEKIRVKPT